MAINGEIFKNNVETNRRLNRDNYQFSFPMIQALDKEGGSSGDFDFRNAIGDFSAAPVVYKREAFEFADAYINEIHITIITSSSMRGDEYGNINGGLTNGILLVLFQRDEFRFVSEPIKMNQDFFRLFSGNVKVPGWKFGDLMYTATLHIDVPIILRGGSTDFFAVQVNDDFTSLIQHEFVVTGFTTNLKEFQEAQMLGLEGA